MYFWASCCSMECFFCCWPFAYRCIDRISIHPPSAVDNVGLNSGHYRCAEPSSRAKSTSVVCCPARAHLEQIWACVSDRAKSPITRRNADVSCARMGPDTTCDINPEVTVALQKQQ